jgi:hypothetical protein
LHRLRPISETLFCAHGANSIELTLAICLEWVQNKQIIGCGSDSGAGG